MAISTSFPVPSVIQGYNPTIDYGRFVAALLIVQFHAAGPLAIFGQAAVGFFVIAMVWFTLLGLRNPKTDFKTFVSTRTTRLCYPFAVWVLLQILAKLASVNFDMAAFKQEVLIFVPPQGTFAHLWFLPWALMISILLGIAFWKRVPVIKTLWSFQLWSLAVIGLCTLCLYVWTFVPIPLIFGLLTLYTASVFTGVLVFACRENPIYLLILAAYFLGAGLALTALGVLGAQQLYISVPLTIVTLMLRTPEFKWTRSLGGISMDVYLCHISVIAVFVSILDVDSTTLLGSAAIILSALFCAIIMQNTKIGRWLH